MVAHHVLIASLGHPDFLHNGVTRRCNLAGIIHADPALSADEFISTGASARLALIVINHFHTVGIRRNDLESHGRVEQAVPGKFRPARVFNRAGVLAVIRPLGQVVKVCSKIGELSAGVIVDPPKRTMTSSGCVSFIRSGAEPSVIVKAFRDGFDFLRRTGRAVMIVTMERVKPAEHAASRDIDTEAKTGVTASLRTGLIDCAVSFHRIRDGPAFGDGQRNRFFAVDIFSGLRRFNRENRMPVVRRGDQHRIYVAPCEDLAKVVVCGAIFVAVSRIHSLLCPDPMIRIDVTNGQHTQIITCQEIPQIVHALTAQTNSAHRESFAWCDASGAAQDR